MQLRPGTVVDRYVVEGVLGEGAVAVVYRARHRKLGSTHAIKLLKAPGDAINERLLREGQLQSTLRHPNVLSVTDLVHVQSTPALVMEFVPGPTLAEFLRHHRLSLEQCDALARDLLSGVAAAHEHGLVHRDLKPSNILIDITTNALVPKVGDFGLAKVIDPEGAIHLATQTGAPLGTPSYMAPEQIQDASSVDTRADVFSLGAILYEMVTGRKCFPADSIMEIWQKICVGSFTPLAEHAADVPRRMSLAIDGALQVDRDARIADVQTLRRQWCTEENGQKVPLDTSQGPEIWPDDLRARASALAPQLLNVGMIDSSGGSDTLDFQGAISANNPAWTPDPETGQRGSAHPSGTNTIGGGRSRDWRWPLALCAATALIGGGWWILDSADEPSPGTVVPSLGPSPSTDASPSAPTRLVQLQRDASDLDKHNLASASQAILDGEFPRAERLLTALEQAHPREPALHALLAISHLFQGRNLVAASEAERAARLSRDMDNDLETLCDIANRSWREPDKRAALLPQWQRLRATYPEDPMVEVLHLIAGRELIGLRRTLTAVRTAREKHPGRVVLPLLELYLLNLLGAEGEMLQSAEKAVGQHPASTSLRAKLGEIQARHGQWAEAERTLKRTLLEDGSLIEARIGLATTYLASGRESERKKQVQLLLAGPLSRLDRTTFLRRHGRALANQGRLHDAKALWIQCITYAEEGLPNEGAGCAHIALSGVIWLEEPAQWKPWMDRLRTATAQLGMDKDLRTFYALLLLWAEATLAARSGHIDEAETIYQKVEAMAPGDLPFSAQDWTARGIRLEILLAQKDAPGLVTHMATKNNPRDRGATCNMEFTLARSSLATADEVKAAQALERVIQKRCAPTRYRGAVRATAYVALADLRRQQGDLEAVKSVVQAFTRFWPQADKDLPLVRRARQLADEN